MKTAVLVVTLFALLASSVTAQSRDPDYEAVLDAYKAKSWDAFDEKAAAFLAEKPGYKYAHSVRYMIAESLRSRSQLREAVEAYEAYFRLHPKASRAGQARLGLVRALNADARHAEAEARARGFLEGQPGGNSAEALAFEYAAALEGQRRFDEAAACYLVLTGRYAERARLQRGVALFRGRRFEEAGEVLRAFLRAYPQSSLRRRATDYLFRTDAGFARIENGIVLDYVGKYETDERFLAVRRRVPELRKASLAKLGRFLGRPPPGNFLIRFADAGPDRSGHFARTRLEVSGGEPYQVLVLMTEYLVMGAFDLERTLTHELYHAVQREARGEEHYLIPKWVREGTAIYAAGQAEPRCRLLAAEVGRRSSVADPLGVLVNGLGGRHTFDDYAEDVSAFTAVEARHGRAKARSLLLRLLETSDVDDAVRRVLDEDPDTFGKAAAKHAREVLGPLVSVGRSRVLQAMKHLSVDDPAAALKALDGDAGVYAPVASWLRARALHEAGRSQEALREVRDVYLKRHRTFVGLLDDVLCLELRILKALDSDEFSTAAERALKDLEPTRAHSRVEALLREDD